MTITKKSEVISVFHNNICVGFIVRQGVISNQCGFNNLWCSTVSIAAPKWNVGFNTRKEAINSLIKDLLSEKG